MKYFTPLEYVYISIANAYGLDKDLWETRIKWTKDNLEGLEELVVTADEKYLYMKGVNALRDIQAGIPTGYVMGLDSTSSGLSIMGILSGCEATLRNTNLIDTGERKDFYTSVTNLMNKKLDKGFECDRKSVKQAAMTSAYGSKATPVLIFGEDTPELKAFYMAMEELAPGAMEIMKDILECWDTQTLRHTWTLPDGHTASVKVTEPVDLRIEIDELFHKTFTHRMNINKPSTYSIPLLANVVQSIDGYIVREMHRMANCSGFELLTIHDEFKASPLHMQEVRENYLAIMIALYESNYMTKLIRDLGIEGYYEQNNTSLSSLIAKAEYSLS
jgi:hypothetical protein